MKHTYFITGFPGFLATSLVKQLIRDHYNNVEHIYLLVLPSQQSIASESLRHIIENDELIRENFTIVRGDITKENLMLDSTISPTLTKKITHLFHLAAVYDLAVPKAVAYNVNVNGTDNVNKWLRNIENLKRYIYFSTAYVSGKREGKIFENELVEGQEFRNHYEHTKYLAEYLVKERVNEIPTTIIRPGVVKGNSKTGQTIKFDGLYFMLNVFDRLRYSPVIPYLGKGTPEGNFVPSDYVLNATSYLAIHPIGEGKTYHLTDPKPYKMREIQKMLAQLYLGKAPKGSIPISVTKAALGLKAIRKWLKVEAEAMDYFTIHSSYDCSQAVRDLSGTGINCPDLKDTLESMVTFYRKYKDDDQMHIHIN
ncbi:SDR family oxidoreductase [Ornithinibacillus xuwenensis]|uniref:SDR family oxidoreductase n=1 Tax=Ornithinibacillus xuwenensis TaxID=3144668 RepID=A0ABU9XII2_9BACI